jgi:putative transposase
MKAYKFKIRRPGKAIVAKFEQHRDLCRELYNSGLRERIDAYKINQVSVTYQDQQNQLPEIKKIREDLNLIYSQVLQDTLKRLDKTFKSFFSRVKKGERRVGFPRFKSKNRYDSFTFPQANGCFRLDGNNLYLSKIGKVKIHLSQTMVGKVKTCTIKKEVSGWFVILTVETEKELLPKTHKSVGIDAGIENFMTLSNGEQIENFKYFEASQKELKRKQRSVSRKKKGSKSRKDAVINLRKTHAKIKNQRNDFAHKVSTRIVQNFDLIAIEDLNIKAMSRSFLSKQIHDVAWNSFFQKLEYKAESAGKKLVKVNPSGTSQTCICGAKVNKTLAQRWHHCLECGLSIHRDIVSAKVVLQRAGHTLLASTKAVRL